MAGARRSKFIPNSQAAILEALNKGLKQGQIMVYNSGTDAYEQYSVKRLSEEEKQPVSNETVKMLIDEVLSLYKKELVEDIKNKLFLENPQVKKWSVYRRKDLFVFMVLRPLLVLRLTSHKVGNSLTGQAFLLENLSSISMRLSENDLRHFAAVSKQNKIKTASDKKSHLPSWAKYVKTAIERNGANNKVSSGSSFSLAYYESVLKEVRQLNIDGLVEESNKKFDAIKCDVATIAKLINTSKEGAMNALVKCFIYGEVDIKYAMGATFDNPSYNFSNNYNG